MRRHREEIVLAPETSINDLPSELYLIIFGFCVENEERNAIRLAQFFALSQVTRYWQSLIVDIVLPYAYTEEDLAGSLRCTNWLTWCQIPRFKVLDLSEYTTRFFKHRDLVRMTSLERLRIMGDERPLFLSDITVLTQLQSLVLQHHTMMPAPVDSISNLQNLTCLTLHRSPINLKEIDFQWMPKLVELRLFDPMATNAACWYDNALSRRLCHITKLLISDHGSAVCGQHLARMTNLVSLSIFRSHVVKFERVAKLPRLVSLTIDSYVHFSVVNQFTNLTSLSVERWVGDGALYAQRVPASFALPPCLTKLNIDRCIYIGDCHLTNLTALTSLSVERCHNITGECFRHMSQLTHLVMGGKKQYIPNEALTRLYSLCILELYEPNYITDPDTSFSHLTNLGTIEWHPSLS